MIPHLPLRIAIMAVTFCLSGFFSGSETALFSFQPDELKRMSEGHGAEARAARLRSRPKRLLITILFGNMVVNVVFYSVSFFLILALKPRIGTTGAFGLSLCALLAVIIGGEVVPKNLAYAFYKPFGRVAAMPLWAFQHAFLPVLLPLEKLADTVAALTGRGAGSTVRAEELVMLASLGAREGVLDAEAGRMIAEVIELSEVRVNEVMVPRVEMVSFDLGDPAEELLELFRSAKLTMIPVYEGTMNQMRGMIHIKDVLFRRDGRSLRDLARPVPFIPEAATVEEALRRCREERSKTAFVVDEYGTVEGLITMEDLLEEIVGEIADEYEPERRPVVEMLDDGRLRLQGRLGLRQWHEISGAEFPELGVDTVSGLVTALLGRVPEVGDRVACGGFTYAVEAVIGRRVASLLASPAGSEGAGGKA